METKTSVEIRTDYISEEGYVAAKNTTSGDPTIHELMSTIESTLHDLGFSESLIANAYMQRLELIKQ